MPCTSTGHRPSAEQVQQWVDEAHHRYLSVSHGSRVAYRHDPLRLLALELAVTAAGYAIRWLLTTPAQALVGMSLFGIGLGFSPWGMSVTVGSRQSGGPGEWPAIGMTSFGSYSCPSRSAAGRDIAEDPCVGQSNRSRVLKEGTHQTMAMDQWQEAQLAVGSTRSAIAAVIMIFGARRTHGSL
jgi:hypothetical protein